MASNSMDRENPKKSNPDSSSLDPAATTASEQTDVSSWGSNSNSTPRSLIPQPSVVSNFEVKTLYPRIVCVEHGQAWVMTGYKTIQLVERGGRVRDTINTDFDFNDMAVTPDGEILFADYQNSCIKVISKQKTVSTLFSTNWTPVRLCCLRNEDIVVTHAYDKKVKVYKRNGEVRKSLDQIKFRCPGSVAVSKVNRGMYICDRENGSHFSPGKLLAIKVNGKLRYEYTGQGGAKFYPVQVCTDHMGNVLITDRDNHRVHILDQEGRFIKYVLTKDHGLDQPSSIDVDSEGYVWVGQHHRVTVARYLQ